MDEVETLALTKALDGIEEEVYITGSRLNPKKRGGDLDILIFSSKNSLKLSLEVSRRFFMECEEKIDVLVFNKDNLSRSEAAFINTLNLIRIK